VSERRNDLPTLTEVVDLRLPAKPEAEPALPPQGESVALDGRGPPMGSQPSARPEVRGPVGAVNRDQMLAYDEELVAHVMVRLQPRLEAWVEAEVRRALIEMLPVWAESASLAVVRDLRAEIPELLSIALDEVHRQRHG
jgi:hypothetical protein